MFRRSRTNPFVLDAVRVINLDHRPERWTSVSRQLTACGLGPLTSRFSAIRGDRFSAPSLVASGLITPLGGLRLERPPQSRVWGMDLTPGGVGCALSHIALWAEIAAHGVERCLVVEDDSLIPATLLDDLEARWAAVPQDWELVYVSGLDTEGTAPALSIGPGVSLVPRMHRTTNCYVVSAKGARRLLDLVVPLTFQLDTDMTTVLSSETRGLPAHVTAMPCYTLHPPLVVQATRFGSDIQTPSGTNPAEEEAGRCAAAGWAAVPE